MGTLGKVSDFFSAHPKRQRAMEEAIEDTQPSCTKSMVKDLCHPHWIERIDAKETFKNMHPSLVSCMEQLCNQGPSQWSTDFLTDTRALLLAITTTDFLSALVITSVLLWYLRPLTVPLQAQAKDIVATTREIDTVKATIQDLQDNIDVHHEEWYVWKFSTRMLQVRGVGV